MGRPRVFSDFLALRIRRLRAILFGAVEPGSSTFFFTTRVSPKARSGEETICHSSGESA